METQETAQSVMQSQSAPRESHRGALRLLYLMGFVFAMVFSLPMYVLSTYLEQFISEQLVGLLFTGGAILNLILLPAAPKILDRLGNYRIMFLLVLAAAFLLLGVGFAPTFPLIASAFILYYATIPFIFFSFDVFLERYSADHDTGRIRGLFLTAINLAIFLGPLVAGFILESGDYWKVFSLAALFCTALMMLLLSNFRNFKDPHYDKIPVVDTLRLAWRNCNFRSIFMANFLLRFFYSWMAIYLPLYLFQHIGFSWGVIGSILAIALVPFILFELPAGYIADKKVGEKEMMALGFLIMASATGALIFLDTAAMWVWAALLFAGRTGASFVEITSESYFFKHVDGTDSNTIGFFRVNRPISYLTAPVIASALLFVLPFEYIFLALGIILLSGVYFSLRLSDTL